MNANLSPSIPLGVKRKAVSTSEGLWRGLNPQFSVITPRGGHHWVCALGFCSNGDVMISDPNARRNFTLASQYQPNFGDTRLLYRKIATVQSQSVSEQAGSSLFSSAPISVFSTQPFWIIDSAGNVIVGEPDGIDDAVTGGIDSDGYYAESDDGGLAYGVGSCQVIVVNDDESTTIWDTTPCAGLVVAPGSGGAWVGPLDSSRTPITWMDGCLGGIGDIVDSTGATVYAGVGPLPAPLYVPNTSIQYSLHPMVEAPVACDSTGWLGCRGRGPRPVLPAAGQLSGYVRIRSHG